MTWQEGADSQSRGVPLLPRPCLLAEPQAAPSPYPGPDRELTSSSGSSLSSGSELVSSPMRKGVGEHTMSIMAGGSTGM